MNNLTEILIPKSPVSLEVNGIPYINFKSATIRRSMETLAGTFDFIATIDQTNNFPIKLQDSVRVIVEDKVVLTGFVEVLSPSYTNDSHEIRVSGRDVTGDVVDSSILEPLNLSPSKGTITLLTVVEKILEGNSISIPVIDKANPDPFKAGDKIDAEVGQNMFEVIDKYCAKRQVLATTDGEGNIILTRGSSDTLNARLIHRHDTFDENLIDSAKKAILPTNTRENNILEANSEFSMTERFNRYVVKTQQNLSSLNAILATIDPSTAVDQTGEATDSDVRSTRILTIQADTSNSTQTATERAVWESNIRRSRSFNYTCVVQGFIAQTSPEILLWQPNFLVEVQDEKSDIDSFLLIKSVIYTFSLDGSKTELNLSFKDSFTLNAEQKSVEKRTNKFGFDLT